MKRIIHAYERKTFKYRDGYRHLDKEEYVGEIHLLSSRFQITDEYGDAGKTTVRIKLPREPKMDDQLIRNVMNNYMGGGCQHEHDCCGCWNQYVDETKKVKGKRRERIVVLRAYRNV